MKKVKIFGGGTKSEGLVPRKCAKSMEGGAFRG